MRSLIHLYNKLRDHRAMKRLAEHTALVGDVANLLTQQHGNVWTAKHCPICAAPAGSPDAKFCMQCGMTLIAPSEIEMHPFAPAQMPYEQLIGYDGPARTTHPTVKLTIVEPEPEYTTDPLYRLNQRPLQTFIEARNQGHGVHTAMTQAVNLRKLRKPDKKAR